MKTKQEIINKAHDIRSEIENCMSDAAYCTCSLGVKTPNDMDAEADRLWNDPDTMRDFVGDRIFWACGSFKTDEDKKRAHSLCQELINISHSALAQAVENFIVDHKLGGLV